jgi:hypothetical protein
VSNFYAIKNLQITQAFYFEMSVLERFVIAVKIGSVQRLLFAKSQISNITLAEIFDLAFSCVS